MLMSREWHALTRSLALGGAAVGLLQTSPLMDRSFNLSRHSLSALFPEGTIIFPIPYAPSQTDAKCVNAFSPHCPNFSE